MICLLAAAVFAPTQVVEMVDSAVEQVSIQALVSLPKLGAKDLARLEILCRAIPKQTQDYPRREMLQVTNGYPVSCDLTSDRLRIVVNVLPANLRVGLSLMDSLLERATLTQENLDAASVVTESSDPWSVALDPVVRPSVKLNQTDAITLYHRVIRPERLLLSVGGKFVAGAAQDAWENRMQAWKSEPMPKGYFDETPIESRLKSGGAVSTLDLRGTEFPAGDVALPTRLLALFALGTGKGASLFRVIREKHAWSYRQESILEPTLEGWQTHLLMASTPSDDLPQRGDTVKSELLEDIKSWTDADRLRALGMAESVIQRGLQFSPLYVLGARPVGDSLEDRTYLNGYWMLKTGKPWNSTAMLTSMQNVSLDDLRQQASEIVSSSLVRLMPGG